MNSLPRPSETPQRSGQQSTSTSQRSSKRNRTDGLQFLGPREQGFNEKILEPAGIIVCELAEDLTPDVISQDTPETVARTTRHQRTSTTSATQDVPTTVGSTAPGLGGVTIDRTDQAPMGSTTMTATQVSPTTVDIMTTSGTFVKLDQAAAERIASQFDLLCKRDHNGQDIRWLVDRFLALADDFVSAQGPKRVVSFRRNNWHLKKSGPEIPVEYGFTYDWVVQPDTTYSVSIKLFEPEVRVVIRGRRDMIWLLADSASVCPYLTFEYKCAEKNGRDSEARNQIAVASALWLLQRQTLRTILRDTDAGSSDLHHTFDADNNTSRQAPDADRDSRRRDLDAEIHHYSIIINSTSYTIYRASVDGPTYKIEPISDGKLNKAAGVLEFRDWINAIHRWGLGRNARLFRQEVEMLLELQRKQAKPGLPHLDLPG